MHLSAPPGTPSLHHTQVSRLPAAAGAGTPSPLPLLLLADRIRPPVLVFFFSCISYSLERNEFPEATVTGPPRWTWRGSNLSVNSSYGLLYNSFNGLCDDLTPRRAVHDPVSISGSWHSSPLLTPLCQKATCLWVPGFRISLGMLFCPPHGEGTQTSLGTFFCPPHGVPKRGASLSGRDG